MKITRKELIAKYNRWNIDLLKSAAKIGPSAPEYANLIRMAEAAHKNAHKLASQGK